jgi:hypothetical protein
MITAEALTASLGGKWHGSYGKASCPVSANHSHGDRTPSLTINNGRDVPIVVKCHAGCDSREIIFQLDARGLWPRDDTPFTAPVLTVPSKNGNDRVTPINQHVGTYQYRDEQGNLLYEKLRYEPKTFKLRAADGSWGLVGVRKVLYRLPDLLAAPQDAPVYIVEGEKDADALMALGVVATTNFDGASGHWDIGYNSAIRDRHIVIIPDNDDAGEKHAEHIRQSVTPYARSVRVVRLSGLPDKGDVSDWLAAGGTAEQLALIVEETGRPVYKLLTPDELRNLPRPEFLANNWLVKHTLSCIYGPSGVGKSFVALDLIFSIASGSEWLGCVPVQQGMVVYIAAEGVGGLAERMDAWCALHPEADISRVRFLTSAVNMIEADQVTNLINSIRAQCDDTPVLVVIDTLARSMVGGDENSAKDMGRVIAAADHIKDELNCHVSVVHHTGKNGDDERGSSALRGACDTRIYVSDENGAIILSCVKQIDSVEPAPIGLKLTPVEGTQSCVLTPFDSTGQISNSAMRLLQILSNSFSLSEGATTTEWYKASGMPEQTFYRARKILVDNKCVTHNKRNDPYLITTIGCRDLDIQPVPETPEVVPTTYYHRTTMVGSPDPFTTTISSSHFSGGNGSSRRSDWEGAPDD